MIERIITLSIQHRWLVILAGLGLAVVGLWAVRDTPIDAIPDLSEVAVMVFADWPGHAPREVEDQVTYPLALGLQGVRGVKAVRTSSQFGFCQLYLILDEATGTAEGRRRVAERMANAGRDLPPDVTPRLGPDAAATGQIYWYTVEGKGYDLGRLRAIQDWYVQPQLAAIPGVAEVAGVGGAPAEYQVALMPHRLRARGVTAAAVVDAIARSNSAVGGHTIQKANAEYLVRGLGVLGAEPGGLDAQSAVIRDIEEILLPAPAGEAVRVKDVAEVSRAPGPRRGVLEKEGTEVVGGVVLMASGENPLAVTRRIKARLHELGAGLPPGVSLVPFYDRTSLIEGAVATVRNTVVEAIVTAFVCVLLVLFHVRTSFIIAVTLPLSVLGSFAIMAALRRTGLIDIETNVMSLAGIAISIGVLVDSSVVMAENAMHHLREHFGTRPASGDLRSIVLPACLEVGRPIFFSVMIMLLSFLPVFALGGIEGKMFHPLAFTKTFALLSVSVLSITLVPALCTVFIRGRLRREQDNPLVRGVIEVYRPVLSHLMTNPAALAWVVGLTAVVGLAPIGSRSILFASLFAAIVAVWLTVAGRPLRLLATGSLVIAALAAQSSMRPIAREFITPLDEGMVMDMPITVPRASITQSADDLKARDMVLCRFPEVDMVVGKAGRADTPTDPAPADMIETMVNFRPREFWPRRALTPRDAGGMFAIALRILVERGIVEAPLRPRRLLAEGLAELLPAFDVQIREFAYLRNAEFLREHAPALGASSHDGLTPRQTELWRVHVRALDSELVERGAQLFARLAVEDLIMRGRVRDIEIRSAVAAIRRHREAPVRVARVHHGGMARSVGPPPVPPIPELEAVQDELATRFGRSLVLWKKERADLVGFGSELDRALQMPGWSNIWTMPIQNRVDMLSTGVNTTVGVRVLGKDSDAVVASSEAIAAALKRIPGSADVVADPVRGKGYLEIRANRKRAAELGVSVGDVTDAIETALAGKVATVALEGRERHAVRVRYARAFREDEASARDILVPTVTRDAAGRPGFVALGEVADIRIAEGPAMIRGEDGMLCNYVRLNVRGRNAVDFVEEARRVVATAVPLPTGVAVSWIGQFEHEARAMRTLMVVLPLVFASIFVVLYWTYRDLTDAILMLLAVPGSIAGGVFFQWLLGCSLSVTVWVGYIACFGMATSTGIIMLVYLRQAVDKSGGLAAMDQETLRRAVLDGASHRLRPKLLTEGITILGLAPMLWATGPGAEVIRPMAAPVLGGLLVADEVIDLLLPVLFYHSRRGLCGR